MFSLASYRVTIMEGYKMARFLEVGVSVGCVSCRVSYNVIVFSILSSSREEKPASSDVSSHTLLEEST